MTRARLTVRDVTCALKIFVGSDGNVWIVLIGIVANNVCQMSLQFTPSTDSFPSRTRTNFIGSLPNTTKSTPTYSAMDAMNPFKVSDISARIQAARTTTSAVAVNLIPSPNMTSATSCSRFVTHRLGVPGYRHTNLLRQRIPKA